MDETLAQRIATEEGNGINFNRTTVRERNENEGIMDDYKVLVRERVFCRERAHNLYLIGRWYRLGRNWWAHGNYVYALGYPREFFTAMIHLAGPNVLNLPNLQASLRDELARSQLTEMSLAELDQTPFPK